MAALSEEREAGLRQADLAARAVLDVEDEVPLSALAVADEGAPCRVAGKHFDRAHIDAVTSQPLEVDQAEIVFADAADDAAGLSEPCHLVDEDGRRSTRERADELQRLSKARASLLRHHLDEDLADGHHLRHGRIHHQASKRLLACASVGSTRCTRSVNCYFRSSRGEPPAGLRSWL